ncbi:hypothetical protein [Priestia flexa]|uniref:hypothetical protein n=1 Tax=Priestia flexa TaxID=86664 RepID=UPI00288F58A0|nr:hypothetical protein [Priestia flexa]MDT2045889.1 hypothetical protein [Priestia flexa]
MEYNDYELLELFEDEPIVMVDEQTGWFTYSKRDDLGFELVLTMLVIEGRCIVSLSYEKHKGAIFDFDLKGIEKIKGENNRLNISGNDGNTEVEISFKPHFGLKTVKLCDAK